MTFDHIHALPPGTRFEEYRLDTVLGAGGFGITYRAHDENLDKVVAIKEYLPDFATRTGVSTVVPKSSTDAQDYHWGLNRFLDEARTLARFDHPHMNKVHRFFEANGTAYMVLEYIDGETLAARLSREARLPEEALQRLLEEVLSGLAVIHEASYVHRDIKPGNLMLRAEDGSAVLLDFGAARQAVGQRSQRLTTILTPGYAPIEQYDGKVDRVGAWTDIYALGMVAYRCISGTGDAGLTDAVARKLAQHDDNAGLAPAVEAGRGRYSPKLLAAIDWAIEVDEEARPQGVGEWSAALAGGRARKHTVKPVRKIAARPAKPTVTERIGMSWSSMALTAVIVVLLGASAWQGWRLYRGMPGVGMADTETTAKLQADIQAEPRTGTESDIRPDRPTAAAPDTPGTRSAPADSTEPEANRPVTEPGASPPPEQDEVSRLLAAAEADITARRLTSPVGNNAWEKYQRVLSLSPAHPEAMAGMERVMGSYLELFGAALEQEDFDKANSYLARIRELHPDSPVLEDGARRIKASKQARANRLARVQSIRKHLDSFETAIRQDKLDEATGYLDRVRALDAKAPGLAEAEQRLAEARQAAAARQADLARQRLAEAARHAGRFEEAMQEGDLDKAARHLAGIRRAHPEAAGLAEAEQRFAKAREAEQKRQRQESEARARKAVGEMVSIPAGTFRMGYYDAQKQVHSVRVAAFKLGKHEVTFAQWDACVADGGCGGYTPDDRGWGRGNRPVMNVPWDDIQLFIKWLNSRTGGNYRLPSEAEWEYAVRAGSSTKYHFGNAESQLCRYGNHATVAEDGYGNDSCSDSVGKRTAEVGRYQPNSFGLYDMHGNVWEWVEDCWNDSYAGAPSDGRAWTSGDCGLRVVRGGSWSNYPGDLRSAYRIRYPRSHRRVDIGFRLAQDK